MPCCFRLGNQRHARLVCETLAAGKHVFVEKPLALNRRGIAADQKRGRAGAGQAPLMVGFNRRFSPHSVKLKELLAGRSEPLCLNMTVNAGIIPPEVWVHDPVRGGGRIIGEACHFIDLMVYLTGSRGGNRDGAHGRLGLPPCRKTRCRSC